MAFFQLVLKARRLEKTRQRYEDEKFRSIELSEGANPRYTFSQRIRRKKLRCKKRILDFRDKLTSFTKDTWFHKKAIALKTEGTFENYVLKSIFGFFGGTLLTYIFFIFFVFQLKFSLAFATTFCSFIGALLSLGLAFSPRIRCIVFLLLPQLFSKRGRQALMAYAFVLALTGPARNTLHNIGVLTESLACGQEQLKQAVKAVVDLIKQPFYALREAISKVIKAVKAVVKKIKQTLVAIKRLVLSILRVIVSVFEWLGNIVNICNKKLGTPFDRCQRVFEGAVTDCKAKLGPIFGGICNLTYIVGALCYVVKPLDFICMLVTYVADAVVDAVKRKIKKFTTRVKAMFYVKLKFSHSFHFETNQSKTIEDVSTGIITEIRSRAEEFQAVFDWMSFLTTFFIFLILLRAVRYRHKWLTNDRFDNRYLTDDLRRIDIIRARQDKETVLPLNRHERNSYVSLTSVTLIKQEKIKLVKTSVLLALATFKLCVYMAIDYCLYWILSTIQYHGQFQTKVEKPNVVRVHVSGRGYLAGLYRSIVRAFTPGGSDMDIDTVACLPNPIPPDYDKYTQILILIAFCWLTAFFEPYGLRLRHIVMCSYHPERSKQRAAWLFNHIIRSRGSFLKFARRQLRRKFGMTDGEKIEKVTMGERLRAICPLLNKCFPQPQNACLLCGVVQRTEKNPHVKCPTPGCVGLFCSGCFLDLQNLCTICQSPLEYGDLSDLSEEKDSSDDHSTLKERKQGFLDEDGRSTEEGSSYSYTYQDESPGTEPDTQRHSFRDLEAQRIQDDVTTQIFHDPLGKEATSSDASSPLPEKGRRRTRARLKKESPGAVGSDSSSSIADTESWPTEESGDAGEEEIALTELDDAREELLPRGWKDKPERGRANRLGSRISWLGKDDRRSSSGKPKTERRSIMSKLASVLRRRKSARGNGKTRRERKRIPSTPTSTDDETKSLIATKSTSENPEEPSDLCHSSSDTVNENVNLKHRRDKKFPAKRMPRYLDKICKETSCFEIDETSDPGTARRCVRQVEEVNALSDRRTAMGKREGNIWNITRHDDSRGCSCQSEITRDTSTDKDAYSTRMRDTELARGVEIPVIRKYLPMYQNPELIEELKRHDRMRLIREREARRDRTVLRSRGNREGLLSLSRKTDGSKEVEQLFPTDGRSRR